MSVTITDFEFDGEIYNKGINTSISDTNLTAINNEKILVQDEVLWGRQYRLLRTATSAATSNNWSASFRHKTRKFDFMENTKSGPDKILYTTFAKTKNKTKIKQNKQHSFSGTKPKSSLFRKPSSVSLQPCNEIKKRNVMQRYNHTASTSSNAAYPAVIGNFGKHNNKRHVEETDQHQPGKQMFCGCEKVLKNRKHVNKLNTLSLLDRAILPQRKYMKLLSHPNVQKKIVKQRNCFPWNIEPCSPRIVQMSMPLKRLVLENWKQFQNILPAGRIDHLSQLLNTTGAVEPRVAHRYFKQLKKKEKKKKHRTFHKLRKPKNLGEKQWLRELKNKLAAEILKYLKKETLLCLNYKELLLSDGLLEILREHGVLKKINRATKNVEKRTIINLSNKVALWAVILLEFLDTIDVDSESDGSQLKIPSMYSTNSKEDQEEAQEEEEKESEEEEEEEGKEDCGEAEECKEDWEEVKDTSGSEEEEETYVNAKGEIISEYSSIYSMDLGEDDFMYFRSHYSH